MSTEGEGGAGVVVAGFGRADAGGTDPTGWWAAAEDAALAVVRCEGGRGRRGEGRGEEADGP